MAHALPMPVACSVGRWRLDPALPEAGREIRTCVTQEDHHFTEGGGGREPAGPRRRRGWPPPGPEAREAQGQGGTQTCRTQAPGLRGATWPFPGQHW